MPHYRFSITKFNKTFKLELDAPNSYICDDYIAAKYGPGKYIIRISLKTGLSNIPGDNTRVYDLIVTNEHWAWAILRYHLINFRKVDLFKTHNVYHDLRKHALDEKEIQYLIDQISQDDWGLVLMGLNVEDSSFWASQLRKNLVHPAS